MKEFRTLRGFFYGEEPDEETTFAYSATLRIGGDGLDFEEIERQLGVKPTHAHRKGEARPTPNAPPWPSDLWAYTVSLDEEEALAKHIDLLWSTIRHAESFLRSLKTTAHVDIFLGYRSNNDMAGVEVPHTSLEMFQRLEVPFGLSIIVA